MAGFKFTDLLNDKSKLQKEINPVDFREIWLSPYEVKETTENFYKMEQIEELADSILIAGQQQPTMLARVNGEYLICNGHRRNRANIYNIERGKLSQNAKVRYLYKDMSPAMFSFSLLVGNAFNRRLTDWEEVQQAERLKATLIRLRDEDGVDIPGRLRDRIAELMDTTPTQIARINKISSSAEPEIKEQLKQGNISINEAYEAARLDPETQQAVSSGDPRGIGERIRQAKEKKENEVLTEPSSESESWDGMPMPQPEDLEEKAEVPEPKKPPSQKKPPEPVSKMDTEPENTYSMRIYTALHELWNYRDFISSADLDAMEKILNTCKSREQKIGM